jgi:hypothetical protein
LFDVAYVSHLPVLAGQVQIFFLRFLKGSGREVKCPLNVGKLGGI